VAEPVVLVIQQIRGKLNQAAADQRGGLSAPHAEKAQCSFFGNQGVVGCVFLFLIRSVIKSA